MCTWQFYRKIWQLINSNRVAIYNAIEMKYNDLLENYQTIWIGGNGIDYPNDETVLQDYHSLNSGEFLDRYHNFINEYFKDPSDEHDSDDNSNNNNNSHNNNNNNNNDEWTQRKLYELKHKLDIIFSQQLQYNYDISVSQCKGALTTIQTKFMPFGRNNRQNINNNNNDSEEPIPDPLESYWRMKGLINDLTANEKIFNLTCKGPAFHNEYYSLYKYFKRECRLIVSDYLKESQKKHSQVFFYYILLLSCYIFIVLLGGGCNNKNFLIHLKIVGVAVLLWTIMILFHPIIHEMGVAGHMDGIKYGFNGFLNVLRFLVFDILLTFLKYIINQLTNVVLWIYNKVIYQLLQYFLKFVLFIVDFGLKMFEISIGKSMDVIGTIPTISIVVVWTIFATLGIYFYCLRNSTKVGEETEATMTGYQRRNRFATSRLGYGSAKYAM